jgi:hypothetical protein
LTWYPGGSTCCSGSKGHYSVLLEDGTRIEVNPDVYARHLNTYLERQGIHPTSWNELMSWARAEWQQACSDGIGGQTWAQIRDQVEARWQEYCQVLDAFAEDYQRWLHAPSAGVFIERPEVQEHKRVQVLR